MYPLRKNRYLRVRKWIVRKLHVIIGIWLLGFLVSLPEYLQFKRRPFCHEGQMYYECRSIWPDEASNQYSIL